MDRRETKVLIVWRRFTNSAVRVAGLVFGRLFGVFGFVPGLIARLVAGLVAFIASTAFFTGPVPDEIDKRIRVDLLETEHESGLEREEWDRRQAEKQRVEELEARLQSRHHTNAEIDYLIRTAPLWDKNKKMLREKYLGKKEP